MGISETQGGNIPEKAIDQQVDDLYYTSSVAGVVELVDTRDLKSRGLRPVPVQVRSPAFFYVG